MYNSLKGAKTITAGSDYKNNLAKEMVLKEDIQAIRYYGGKSPKESSWFTTIESNSPEYLKKVLSLPEGATAEEYVKVTIPKDTRIRTGFAQGGGTQIEIPDMTMKELKEKIFSNTVESGYVKNL